MSQVSISPTRLLAYLVCWILVVELTIMFALQYLFSLSQVSENFIDAISLTAITWPAVYFFVLKPLRLELRENNVNESLLKESEERFRLLFDSSPVGAVLSTVEGEIIAVNKMLVKLFGYPEPELRKTNTLDLYTDPGERKRLLNLLSKEGKASNFKTILKRRNGSSFDAAINSSFVSYHNSRMILSTVEDTTKQMEIDKAKDEFVSLASHQLRTPLGITKWYLEAIQKEPYIKNAPKTVSDYLNELYKDNERVILLVGDLLSVSHINQGHIKDNPQRTNIVQLVQDAVKGMRVLAGKKNIKLDLVIKPDNLPIIFIDPLRLHEVIQNLVANAVEYNNPNGKVKITIDQKTDNALLISVEDTGIGISTEDQKKLFTKFFRSEKGAASNTEGSGLGLYLVKSYIEGWGGKISVVSKEGVGSKFTMTMPFNIMETKGSV